MIRAPGPTAPRLDHVRGVVIGVDEFDDEVDTVRLDDLGPHERARIAARLRQVLAQLGDDRPARLH